MRWRRGGATAVALGVLGLVVVGAGCTGARNDLGTTSGQCFRAIPVARAAVHGRGSYAGTVLVSVDSLRATSRLRLVADRAGPRVRAICLVAYKGTYRLEQVMGDVGNPPPGGVGTYAVVVVSSPGNLLLGTTLFRTVPVRFRHVSVGA
jgi:hypothetical protein